MRRTVLSALVLATLLLAGCSAAPEAPPVSGALPSAEASAPVAETAAPPLDLTGDWTQRNSESPDSYQTATIAGDTIVVNWVSPDSTALYWAGSYVAPGSDQISYSWDSTNDVAQTENALLASDAPTKAFAYDAGVLSYELSALGVTTTVELERR